MAIHVSSRQVTVLCGWVNRHHGLDAVFTQIVECCGFFFFFSKTILPQRAWQLGCVCGHAKLDGHRKAFVSDPCISAWMWAIV